MEFVVERTSSLNGLQAFSQEIRPPMQIVRELPSSLRPKALEQAVKAFIAETDVQGDANGFLNQTMETIANATFLRRGGDLWLAEENGEVMGYVIGSVSKDIDGALTYWLNQAWANPLVRAKPIVKEWWEGIRAKARDYLCRHIVIVSARGDKAYCRWLGHGVHLYAHLLKEDI